MMPTSLPPGYPYAPWPATVAPYPRIGAEEITDSRTPGSNTQALVEAFTAFSARGESEQELKLLQQKIEEARRVEDSHDPDAASTQRQLDIARSRNAPRNVIASLEDKLARAKVREQSVQLDSTTLSQALENAMRSGAAADRITQLQLQLSAAVERELSDPRFATTDPIDTFLRLMHAIAANQAPEFVQGLRRIFSQQKRDPIDSTFVNRAFNLAVARRASGTELQNIKDLQRNLIPQDIARAQGAARNATTEQRRLMWQAAIAAGSPPQLIDALKHLYDEAVVSDAAAAAAAAAARPSQEGAATTAPTTAEEEKPSLVMQVLTVAALTAPAWGTYLLARR